MGYKTARPQTGDWEWLWHHSRTASFTENRFLRHFFLLWANKFAKKCYTVQKCVVYKKIRKCWRNMFSVKLEVPKWCHKHSQFPVFELAVLYPTGSEISRFWYIKTRGRKLTIKYFFLLYLSVHCGDFIKQIKKICHIHFKGQQIKMALK